jgi:hypothetical protein
MPPDFSVVRGRGRAQRRRVAHSLPGVRRSPRRTLPARPGPRARARTRRNALCGRTRRRSTCRHAPPPPLRCSVTDARRSWRTTVPPCPLCVPARSMSGVGVRSRPAGRRAEAPADDGNRPADPAGALSREGHVAHGAHLQGRQIHRRRAQLPVRPPARPPAPLQRVAIACAPVMLRRAVPCARTRTRPGSGAWSGSCAPCSTGRSPSLWCLPAAGPHDAPAALVTAPTRACRSPWRTWRSPSGSRRKRAAHRPGQPLTLRLPLRPQELPGHVGRALQRQILDPHWRGGRAPCADVRRSEPACDWARRSGCS